MTTDCIRRIFPWNRVNRSTWMIDARNLRRIFLRWDTCGYCSTSILQCIHRYTLRQLFRQSTVSRISLKMTHLTESTFSILRTEARMLTILVKTIVKRQTWTRPWWWLYDKTAQPALRSAILFAQLLQSQTYSFDGVYSNCFLTRATSFMCEWRYIRFWRRTSSEYRCGLADSDSSSW